MKTICIDFGHSGPKALDSEGNSVFLKNLIAPKGKPIDTSSFIGDYDPMNYCVVEFKGFRYALGKYANNFKMVRNNVHSGDVMNEDAHMLVLAAIAYLDNSTNIETNLTLNLPAAEYNKKNKEDYKKQYEGKSFEIKTWDYDRDKMVTNKIEVVNVDVKVEGFYGLVDYIYDDNLNKLEDREKFYRGLICVVNIGYFSVGITFFEDLKYQINLTPKDTLEGIKGAYQNIGDELREQFNISKKPYELEKIIVEDNCEIDLSSDNVLDVSKVVEAEYKYLAHQIKSEIKNISPMNEVRTIFLDGGGAIPIEPYFKKGISFKDPRGASARGGVKWGELLWGENR